MKRDWDVIREVLIEIEGLSDDADDPSPNNRGRKIYGLGDEHSPSDAVKSRHAILLWEADYVSALDASTMAGPAIISPDLTWQGHDLLDTLRSKAVWERIKSTAKEKGIELTFDAVKALGAVALKSIIGS